MYVTYKCRWNWGKELRWLAKITHWFWLAHSGTFATLQLMVETKVPWAKAFDELFSRGGTEVNWMGLDVDELQTRNQRVKSYWTMNKEGPLEVKSNLICEQMKWFSVLHLQYGWGPLRMRSNLVCGWIFWNTHVKLQLFYLYNHLKQVIPNLYIGSSLQGGVHSRYTVYRWLHSLLTTIYKCNSSEVNSLNLKPYTLKAYSLLWLKDLSDYD